MGKQKRKTDKNRKTQVKIPSSIKTTKSSGYCKLKTFANIITNLFAIVGTVFTVVSVFQWFVPNDNVSSAAIATKNYEQGLIYLEDDKIQEAEKHFETAYNINNSLLDVKYYYAYTEYLLGNYDESYKILQENRTRLNEDELAFYAMYEFDKGNYEAAELYLNKIGEPEKLSVISLTKYALTSLKLAFLKSYSDGLNTYNINTLILNVRFEEIHPSADVHLYTDDTFPIDKALVQATLNRIANKNSYDEVMLMRCKLSMFMLFLSNSIESDQELIPIHFFSDAAYCFDYYNNHGMSMQFLVTLILYTTKMPLDPFYLKKIESAYEIIVDRYQDMLTEEEKRGTKIILEEDREGFQGCEKILNDFRNNTFNPNKYKFVLPGDELYDDYSSSAILDLWRGVIQDYYYE